MILDEIIPFGDLTGCPAEALDDLLLAEPFGGFVHRLQGREVVGVALVGAGAALEVALVDVDSVVTGGGVVGAAFGDVECGGAAGEVLVAVHDFGVAVVAADVVVGEGCVDVGAGGDACFVVLFRPGEFERVFVVAGEACVGRGDGLFDGGGEINIFAECFGEAVHTLISMLNHLDPESVHLRIEVVGFQCDSVFLIAAPANFTEQSLQRKLHTLPQRLTTTGPMRGYDSQTLASLVLSLRHRQS